MDTRDYPFYVFDANSLRGRGENIPGTGTFVTVHNKCYDRFGPGTGYNGGWRWVLPIHNGGRMEAHGPCAICGCEMGPR
jgi:hypothetical protein